MHDHVRQRLRNQRLIGSGFNNAAAVVNWLGAVQAQDFHGAKWAVGQRMTSATDAELEMAFDRGEILRTHVLRPTWHFVTPRDIHWIQSLTGPRVQALNASMYRQLELDSDTLVRTSSRITGMLAGGNALTRKEIGLRLGEHRIEATGQRLAFIVMYAELEALICSGPLEGKQHTYALVDERTPSMPPLDRDEALVQLAERFFRSHGPATIHDFAWWSGLTVTDTRRAVGMATDLEQVELHGATWWSGPGKSDVAVPRPSIHLLPNYDELFSRDNRRSPYPNAASVNQRAAAAAARLFVHHIVVDGAWRGGWRRQLTSKQVRIRFDPVDAYSFPETTALAEAAQRYGGFLQRSVTLE